MEFLMARVCANPAGAASFLYLERRKVFRFDVKEPCEPWRDIPEQIRELKPNRSSVFFWLCHNCWSTMALRSDQHQGLAFMPLKSGERGIRLTGLKGQQEYSAPPLLSRGQASAIGIATNPMEGRR